MRACTYSFGFSSPYSLCSAYLFFQIEYSHLHRYRHCCGSVHCLPVGYCRPVLLLRFRLHCALLLKFVFLLLGHLYTRLYGYPTDTMFQCNSERQAIHADFWKNNNNTSLSTWVPLCIHRGHITPPYLRSIIPPLFTENVGIRGKTCSHCALRGPWWHCAAACGCFALWDLVSWGCHSPWVLQQQQHRQVGVLPLHPPVRLIGCWAVDEETSNEQTTAKPQCSLCGTITRLNFQYSRAVIPTTFPNPPC